MWGKTPKSCELPPQHRHFSIFGLLNDRLEQESSAASYPVAETKVKTGWILCEHKVQAPSVKACVGQGLGFRVREESAQPLHTRVSMRRTGYVGSPLN